MNRNDTKKVEYDCIDCGKHVERELNALDRGDLTPSRCVSCVLDRMVE
jgi:DNA-directed RNA polymerase subunit RPC12/RpoP